MSPIIWHLSVHLAHFRRVGDYIPRSGVLAHQISGRAWFWAFWTQTRADSRRKVWGR